MSLLPVRLVSEKLPPATALLLLPTSEAMSLLPMPAKEPRLSPVKLPDWLALSELPSTAAGPRPKPLLLPKSIAVSLLPFPVNPTRPPAPAKAPELPSMMGAVGSAPLLPMSMAVSKLPVPPLGLSIRLEAPAKADGCGIFGHQRADH
jgi:hypothetical protein